MKQVCLIVAVMMASQLCAADSCRLNFYREVLLDTNNWNLMYVPMRKKKKSDSMVLVPISTIYYCVKKAANHSLEEYLVLGTKAFVEDDFSVIEQYMPRGTYSVFVVKKKDLALFKMSANAIMRKYYYEGLRGPYYGALPITAVVLWYKGCAFKMLMDYCDFVLTHVDKCVQIDDKVALERMRLYAR
jgi:hypothetical protein